MTDYPSSERSLARLFTELSHEIATLFRQETELAKAELTEKVVHARNGLAAVIGGGLVLFVAVLALVAAAILGLSAIVESWLAALIVAVIIGIAGSIVLTRGVAILRRGDLTPRRTMETLRANTRWARERLP